MQDALSLKPKEGSYHQDVVIPSQIVKNGGEYLLFFRVRKITVATSAQSVSQERKDLQGEWSIATEPALPVDEQIENSSLFYQSLTKT
jgi:hypothetical protein